MLIRWTIPRFRFDQLMELAWKVFIPLSLANVVAVMTVLQFGLEPMVAAADCRSACSCCAGVIAVTAKRCEINRRRRASLATAVRLVRLQPRQADTVNVDSSLSYRLCPSIQKT